MTISKTINSFIDRKFSFQIATPTHDLSTAQDIINFINPQASYTLIPGVQNSSLLDPEKILLQILPLTANCMVDITMPYIELTKRKAVFKHLARYIICNRQLIAIRVKPSDNWPKSKSLKQPISPSLQNFYLEQGITNYQKEIFIGQFIVITPHFKIAPLFASELSIVFDNATVNLLNDYYSLGCEVFSVVNDLTQEKKKSLKDPYEILKNYRRQSTVMLYCGMHLALDPHEIYKTKSFAIQSSNTIKKIHVSNLDEKYTQFFIGEFNRTKRLKNQDGFAQTRVIDSQIQILDFTHLRIQYCNKSLSLNEINNFQQLMDEENDNNQAQQKLNDLLLYFWHLFVDINKRKPFILPCPLNEKDETLLKNILFLTSKTNIPEVQLVQFLKLDTKIKIPKKYQQKNFKSIFLDRVPARQIDTLYLYFHLKERILLNNIEKDQTFLSEVEKRIVNCSGCIPQDLLKSLENRISNQKASVVDQDQKFVKTFMNKKNAISLEMFYYEIAKYYPRNKLDSQFIESMFKCLQQKIRKQFSGTPFQNFILQTTFDQVRHIFAQSEQKYFPKPMIGSLKTQQDPKQGKQNENQQNNFRNYIKKIRYHCNAQKKNYYSCHICNSLFSKKEKASWGRLCISCNNFVCHSCFDLKTGETAQSQESFQQCLVCQNKCDCDKCTKKKARLQPSFTQKSSIIRQTSQIFDSFKDIGAESQMFQNQNKEIKSLFIKSEMVMEREGKSILFSKNQPQVPNINQQSIKPCLNCELSGRVDRIIKFECSSCKDIKCLSCEKFQLPHRNWVLRGSVICNKCNETEKQNNVLKAQIKNLQGKNMALEHQKSVLQRQKMSSVILQNNISFANDTYDQGNQYVPSIEVESKNQKGAATPLFDRSGNFSNQGKSSPAPFHGRRNSSQNGSIASFGGQKLLKNKSFAMRNQDNSSVSGSVASKRSVPQNKQQMEKKRKNSSCSSAKSGSKSLASFQEKPKKALSNSSRQSVQSGQYQDSSSSRENFNPEPKKDWKKNYHQDNYGQEKVYDNSRGGHRGRGRGRGGYQNQSFDQRDRNKNWGSSRNFQNRNDNRNEYQNNKREGYQSKKWENNNSNKGWGSKNYNNNDRNSQRYDNNDNYRRQQESKQKIDEEDGNYYLGKMGSKVTSNDDDVDY